MSGRTPARRNAQEDRHGSPWRDLWILILAWFVLMVMATMLVRMLMR